METKITSKGYRIQNNQITTINLPELPAAYIIPEKALLNDKQGIIPVSLLTGPASADFEDFSLPLAQSIATRITPWATWYFTPQFVGMEGFNGFALQHNDIAVCKINGRATFLAQIVFHEAWHLCEYYMEDEILNELDRQLSHGPAWPGDYYPRACERRARAFAGFAIAILEGTRLMVAGPGIPFETALFWHVYSGGFAAEITQPEPAKPARNRLERIIDTVWGG